MFLRDSPDVWHANIGKQPLTKQGAGRARSEVNLNAFSGGGDQLLARDSGLELLRDGLLHNIISILRNNCTFFAFLFGVSHIRQKKIYKIKMSPESRRSSHWTWQTQSQRPKIPEELKLYHVKAMYFVDNMITRHFSSFTVTCRRQFTDHVLCVTFDIRT